MAHGGEARFFFFDAGEGALAGMGRGQEVVGVQDETGAGGVDVDVVQPWRVGIWIGLGGRGLSVVPRPGFWRAERYPPVNQSDIDEESTCTGSQTRVLLVHSTVVHGLRHECGLVTTGQTVVVANCSLFRLEDLLDDVAILSLTMTV
jgi:hypothetical protein